jgi:hypothetical protein
VCIHGTARCEADSAGSATAVVLKERLELWPRRVLQNGQTSSHDFTVSVKKGDTIFFIAGMGDRKRGAKVVWDPVVTYVEEGNN